MKSVSGRKEKLRRLLRVVHHARQEVELDDAWTRQTMDQVRQMTDSGRRLSPTVFWERYYWRWMAVGGMATAAMAMVLFNFQFVPDGDLWSFLVYENETLNMLQTFLY